MNLTVRTIQLKLPENMNEKSIVFDFYQYLLDKAFTKMEYYKTRIHLMESNYKTQFSNFKKQIENSTEEKFQEWDDLIIWEGYEIALVEWKSQYEALQNCLK